MVATGTITARVRDCSRDGFIVVAVLWILAALATLAAVASAYVAQSAVALTANDDTTQSDLLVRAAIELVAYQVSSPVAERRPRHGTFELRLVRTDIGVDFMSEAARINLNTAPKAMIAGLFAALGAGTSAEQYADRVIGWRRSPKPDAQDDEDALYRAAGLAYFPRRGPFSHIDELWLVLGLPPALVERALPFVTIYSGMRDINVLDAAPEVVAALPGMSPGRLNAFLNERETLPPDPEFIAGALGAQEGITTKASDAYRVRIRLGFPDGRRKTAEVVIAVNTGGDGPYGVLSWRDDIDRAASRMAEARR